MPLGSECRLELPSCKVLGITRPYMEENSAKMFHQGADSLVGLLVTVERVRGSCL